MTEKRTLLRQSPEVGGRGPLVAVGVEMVGPERVQLDQDDALGRSSRRALGKALANGTAKGGGVDGAGPLSFTVAAKVARPTLAYLEVLEPSPSGGAPASRVIVPVVLTP